MPLAGGGVKKLGEAILRKEHRTVEAVEGKPQELGDPGRDRFLPGYLLEALGFGIVRGMPEEVVGALTFAPESPDRPPRLSLHLEPQLDVC